MNRSAITFVREVRTCAGEVFIFINRSQTTVKLLHRERDRRCYHLRWHDLVMMAAGISIEKAVREKRYEKFTPTA